jgi:hypothetical protein
LMMEVFKDHVVSSFYYWIFGSQLEDDLELFISDPDNLNLW